SQGPAHGRPRPRKFHTDRRRGGRAWAGRLALVSGFRLTTGHRTVVSRHRASRRSAGAAAGEDAAAEEGAFQRRIAMHAAAAETGGLANGIEPRYRLAIGAQHAAVEIGLQ